MSKSFRFLNIILVLSIIFPIWGITSIKEKKSQLGLGTDLLPSQLGDFKGKIQTEGLVHRNGLALTAAIENYQWHTFLGSTRIDSGNSIATDDFGNIYMAGESRDAWNGPAGQPPLHAYTGYSGNSEIVVVKVDSDGAYQWHTFFGFATSYANAITLDSSGNIYITGISNISWNGPSGELPLHAFSYGNDIVVIKLNSAGAYQWHTYFGSNDYDDGYGIATDASGNVYVSGSCDTSWNGPSGQSALHLFTGGYDQVVIKLDTNGAYQWHTFYGVDWSYSYSIAADSQGNVYLTGNSHAAWNGPSGESPIHAYSGYYDVVVLKLNSAGVYQWHTFYGTGASDTGYGITVDHNGYIYVTGGGSGAWNGPNNQPPLHSSVSGNGIFVFKLDSNGAYLWHTFYGEAYENYGKSISVDGSGNIYVTGTSYATWSGPSGIPPLHPFNFYYDIFVFKLNTNGAYQWHSFYGSNSYDFGYGVAVDSSGNVYVTGKSDAAWAGPAGQLPLHAHSGNYDIDLIKFASDSHIYSIYGLVRDSAGNPVPGVTISDGGSRSTITANDGTYTISGFPPGIYALTPLLAGFTFIPSAIPISVVDGDIQNQNFTAYTTPGVDLSIEEVTPIQVIEGADLVNDKETAVKVKVHKSGNEEVKNVSVKLTNGNIPIEKFYVVITDTNIITQSNQLIYDNFQYPLSFSPEEHTKTIYFFDPLLAPIGSPYQVTAEVDASHSITETNENNNVLQSPVKNVFLTTWTNGLFFRDPKLLIHYFPVEWNNTKELQSFANRTSDYIKAIFPVAKSNFDWKYEKRSMFSPRVYSSDKVSGWNIGRWIFDVYMMIGLANPKVDILFGVVPNGWFKNYAEDSEAKGASLYNNMVHLVEADAAPNINPLIGDTQYTSHEVGHQYLTIGIPNLCDEEYEDCFSADIKGIGNYAVPGFYVSKLIPIINPMGVGLKDSVLSIMAKGIGGPSWIEAEHYNELLNSHKLNEQSNPIYTYTPNLSNGIIMASGILSDSQQMVLNSWYTFDEGDTSEIQPGPYSFDYLDSTGNTIATIPFDISSHLFGTNQALPAIPFAFKLPYISETSQILVRKDGRTLAVKNISPNSPSIILQSPLGGDVLQRNINIQWKGSDIDNDTLKYAVLCSADNGATWNTIAYDLVGTNYMWNDSTLSPGNQYLIKVIVTDGFNTNYTVTQSPFTVLADLFLPLVSTR